MSLRNIISTIIDQSSQTLQGKTASGAYKVYDAVGNWQWCCDIDIGDSQILRGIPIAFNNRDISYSEIGKAVTLSRLNKTQWAVTGLSKSVYDTIHYIYLTFTDDTYAIDSDVLVGRITRVLTYGEMSTLASPVGYGTLPYGVIGTFNLNGDLIEIAEE
jgi:hypothetical protein